MPFILHHCSPVRAPCDSSVFSGLGEPLTCKIKAELLTLDYFSEVILILQLFHKQNVSGVGEEKEEYNFLLLLPVHKSICSVQQFITESLALATSDHMHGSTLFDWEEWLSGHHLQTVPAINCWEKQHSNPFRVYLQNENKHSWCLHWIFHINAQVFETYIVQRHYTTMRKMTWGFKYSQRSCMEISHNLKRK